MQAGRNIISFFTIIGTTLEPSYKHIANSLQFIHFKKTIMTNIKGKKVAILSETGFEQSELFSPKQALENSGVKVEIISPRKGTIRGWEQGNWGKEIQVDKTTAEADPDDYIAVVLPGGVMNPDKLRMNKDAVEFVKRLSEDGKIIAAICHGPQTLIETGLLSGREMTSFPSLKTDLRNAGAHWSDQEVVVDMGLITSRTPDDLPAFNEKLMEQLSLGIHEDIS